MATFTITLHAFSYPEDLPNRKANFRFLVAVRLQDANGSFVTEHAVMPSFDTFWECDKGKSGELHYVRDGNSPSLDMEQVDDWDKLVLRVSCKAVDSVQLTVIDVNRKDAWEKVKSVLGALAQVVLSNDNVKATLTQPRTATPTPIKPESLGSAASDIKTFTLRKLAGGNDVLFRRSGKVEDGSISITGRGKDGQYKAQFTVVQE